MAVEIELKARVRDCEGMKTSVQRIAAYTRTVLQKDSIIDYADGRLKKSGKALRIRQVEVIHGKGSGQKKTIITLKGKRRDSGAAVKQREEEELEALAEVAEVFEAAKELGLGVSLSYEKLREDYDAGEIKICIDSFPRHPALGHFIEIEAPTEKLVKWAANEIGIGKADVVKETYPEIVGKAVAAAKKR